MKKLYFFLIAIVLSIPQLANAQCTSCSVTISSDNSNDMNFTSGTYCFTAGTFTGNISGLSAGATVCVGPNATFKPSNINGTMNGTIRVYGTCQLPTINIGDNFNVENYKNCTFNGNLNFNGSNAKINNYNGGSMLFTSSFQLDKGGSVSNAGAMQFNADFNTTSNTTLYNIGKIRLNGSFNPSGNVLNQGLVVAKNVININSGSNVTNNCKFVSVKGFTNNAYFKNNGLVWVTSLNEAESHIQNNAGATLETGAKSTLRGMQFTNNGTVQGAGMFFFTNTTRQQGSFIGTNSSAPMNFYDATQSVGLVFDFPQANQQYTYTVRTLFVPADTNTFDCSATMLPLQLTDFDAQVLQNKQVLLTWQTQNENNLKNFVIERTSNTSANTWRTIGTTMATGNSSGFKFYQLTDNTPINGAGYYRIKAVDNDGKETYSAIRQVNMNSKLENLQVYPTIVQKGSVLKVLSTEAANYQLIDASGKKMMSGKLTSGANLLNINVSAGSYIVVTTNDNNIHQHSKIIVQ